MALVEQPQAIKWDPTIIAEQTTDKNNVEDDLDQESSRAH